MLIVLDEPPRRGDCGTAIPPYTSPRTDRATQLSAVAHHYGVSGRRQGASRKASPRLERFAEAPRCIEPPIITVQGDGGRRLRQPARDSPLCSG